MLAAPPPHHSLPSSAPTTTLFTQHNSHPSLQCKPVKNMEEFNKLLPPPVEFVEGSSSGTIAVAEGKYEPINVSPNTTSRVDRSETPKKPAAIPSSPVKPSSASISPHGSSKVSLHPGGIDTSWPATFNRASGLYNNGNTCFLNSALQCLLHTPPLLRLILSHKKDSCQVEKFCMVCSMHLVTVHAYSSKSAFSPSPISNKLQIIAKHMRKGRQEDSHEFLRYAIDALQKACLAGLSARKIDPKLAETTWVYKIFGGRLRSRVSCQNFEHHSDTYDRILDLSLDIMKSDTLKDALRKFVASDYLRGSDQYKCEKCEKHVNAVKSFTIHEAPLVLTIHLKRFSPLGRKIGHQVNYDEHLSLKPYMSVGQRGPTYSLYGVICHAGGGPNSGHYYAFVKDKSGRWWEMNDESVTPVSSPTNHRNAYILFYLQNKGQGLEAAIEKVTTSPSLKSEIAANMKKRKERDEGGKTEEEDKGQKVSRPFIGPLLPSHMNDSGEPSRKIPRLDGPDPQAARLQSRIEAVSARTKTALKALEAYDSQEEDGASEQVSPTPKSPKHSQPSPANEASPPKAESHTNSLPTTVQLPKNSPTPTANPSFSTVPPSSFYAAPSNTNGKKRKSPSAEMDEAGKKLARTPIPLGNSSPSLSSTLKSRSSIFSPSPSRKSLKGSAFVDPHNPFKNLHSGIKMKMKRRFAV